MEIIFLRGLPGSGKSEWAEYYQTKVDKEAVVLSFDEVLYEYDPASYEADYTAAFHKNYREVVNLIISRITGQAVGGNVNTVILDMLNLDYDQTCKLADAVFAIDRYVKVRLVNFFISVEDSVRRQQRRKSHTVAEERVRQMDVALRKLGSCNFPGPVVTLRFDTSELITVYEVGSENTSSGTTLRTCTASFDPNKSMLI